MRRPARPFFRSIRATGSDTTPPIGLSIFSPEILVEADRVLLDQSKLFHFEKIPSYETDVGSRLVCDEPTRWSFVMPEEQDDPVSKHIIESMHALSGKNFSHLMLEIASAVIARTANILAEMDGNAHVFDSLVIRVTSRESAVRSIFDADDALWDCTPPYLRDDLLFDEETGTSWLRRYMDGVQESLVEFKQARQENPTGAAPQKNSASDDGDAGDEDNKPPSLHERMHSILQSSNELFNHVSPATLQRFQNSHPDVHRFLGSSYQLTYLAELTGMSFELKEPDPARFFNEGWNALAGKITMMIADDELARVREHIQTSLNVAALPYGAPASVTPTP